MVKSSNKSQNPKIWDKAYDEYDIENIEKFFKKSLRKRTFAEVDRNISKAKNIVELGFGTGATLIHLARKYPKKNFYGFDFSPKAISNSKSLIKRLKIKNIQIVKMDILNVKMMKKYESKFDLIYSQGLIEHFKKKELKVVMNNQKMILNKNGLLIIDVPQLYTFSTVLKKVLIKLDKWPFGWEREFSKSQMKRLGRDYGLKIRAIKKAGQFALPARNIFLKVGLFKSIYNKLDKNVKSPFFFTSIVGIYIKK